VVFYIGAEAKKRPDFRVSAANICFWHLADIAAKSPDVRFWG
jgi:hypothetical protein